MVTVFLTTNVSEVFTKEQYNNILDYIGLARWSPLHISFALVRYPFSEHWGLSVNAS